MRPEDLVRIRDLSLAEKTRLAYLEGFETEFRRRWNRKPTVHELEPGPSPVPPGRSHTASGSLIRSKKDEAGRPGGAMPRCRQSDLRSGSAGR